LIALIAKARFPRSPIGNRGSNALARKDQFCFKRIRGFERSASKNPRLVARRRLDGARPPCRFSRTQKANLAHPAFDRMRFLFTMSDIKTRNGRDEPRPVALCTPNAP